MTDLMVAIKFYIINLVGEYQLCYTDDGVLVGGVAGVDYAWLTSAALLMLSILRFNALLMLSILRFYVFFDRIALRFCAVR